MKDELSEHDALKDLLNEGEQKVPSTAPRIIAVLREERERQTAPRLVGMNTHPLEQEPSTLLPKGKAARVVSRYPGTKLQTALSLIAAILLVISLSLLTRFLTLHPASSNGSATPLPQPTIPLPYNEWHDVLIVSSDLRATTIANYDVLNGSNTLLTAPKLPLDGTHVDGISHDGSNVLYHLSSSGYTLYYTLTPVARTGFFYQLTDENIGSADNAVWLPDNRHVLISTANSGVVKVDIQTGQSDTVLPTLKTAGLVVYRAPYLYFVGAEDRATGALYRVNVNVSNAVPVQVTWRSPNTTFWVSPDGATVYFVNNGSAGQAGIYALKSDGSTVSSNPQPLRRDGAPVGYAADNKLVIMNEVRGKFQLVKVGATPNQDQVLLADVAPNAVSLCEGAINPGIVPICDSSIALAPLGGALVVEAGYTDGSHKVWSIDLQTGARFELTTPAGLLNVQLKLIGWDQIAGN